MPQAKAWVGTWACSPQLTEPENQPPSPGLAGNTLRQIVRASIGGGRLRLRLSNEHGDGPVTLHAVRVAVSVGGDAIDAATDTAVTFGGEPAITIAPGEAVFSDAFVFALASHAKLAITIAFGAAPKSVTGHPGSRTTSYLVAGDAAAAARLPGAAATEHWYYIAGVDVIGGQATAAVITLGDSLTDGRGSTTDGDDRWPDVLSRRLRAHAPTANVAVLNQGIGGNAVLSGGLGPTATARFTRDVLDQRGARWLIVLEGVNDIGCSPDSGARSTADRLIDRVAHLAGLARARGLRVYGATITPFSGSQYGSEDHESARQRFNTWIRTTDVLDAAIDFDVAVRDPENPVSLLAAYDSGDHLHLSPTGYQRMADAIDLVLFET